MATPDQGRVQANGNEGTTGTLGNQKLAAALQQIDPQAIGTPGAKAPAHHPRTFDNLMSRTDLTAEACDELARYFTSLAEHFRKTGREVRHNVLQMLGDIGTPDRGRGQA